MQAHSDLIAHCAKCGERAESVPRGGSGILIGVNCDCDGGLVIQPNDRQAHAIRRAKEVLRVGLADDSDDVERLTRYLEEALELLIAATEKPAPGAPSVGTARDDAGVVSDERAAETINAAKRYASDWDDWATLAHRARFMDRLDDLYLSHRRLSERVAALRSSLAEREAECERLRADAERLDWLQEYSSYDIAPAAVYLGFDDIASVVTDHLRNTAPFNVRRMLDAARGVSSAAVAPADDKEEWTCRACGRMTTGGTWVSTPRCGWCGADRAAVAPAAHIGKHWRGCAACEAQANSTAHLFSPESDVGPFDAACVLCGHLHDGEVCPAVAPAARETQETTDG
jgi:hypothetical protein